MKIYVECYPDEVLVGVIAERLRFSKKNIDHRGGKARICKILEEKYCNCIALLDEDPHSTQPPYLKRGSADVRIDERTSALGHINLNSLRVHRK